MNGRLTTLRVLADSRGDRPVPDRLGSLDVSFLYVEDENTPMHVGSVAIFAAEADPLDLSAVRQLVSDRIALVPRYRQKVRSVPGHIAYPVWVDDPDYELDRHVVEMSVAPPGSDADLRALTAQLMAERLPRDRPLWQMVVVTGLRDGRTALITKTHHAMVDGVSAVDLGQVVLDPDPRPAPRVIDDWIAAPEPTDAELVAAAVGDLVRRPSSLVDTVRLAANDAEATLSTVARRFTGVLAAARTAARPAPVSPLNAEIGARRRLAVARTDLDDYRRIRRVRGGTVNDVVLAVVGGALRFWLLSRGILVPAGSVVRALVPVSVRSEEERGSLGNRVSSYLVDLPVGEANPVLRLAQVSFAMASHKEAGQSVGASALVRLSGFAPPTLHAMGARAASARSRRLFNVAVSNVPGPQFPLYAAGARMDEVYPVVPLAHGQAVSIGLTSYDGGVFFGLNADYDAMSDVETLADLIEGSLRELLSACCGGG